MPKNNRVPMRLERLLRSDRDEGYTPEQEAMRQSLKRQGVELPNLDNTEAKLPGHAGSVEADAIRTVLSSHLLDGAKPEDIHPRTFIGRQLLKDLAKIAGLSKSQQI